MYYVAIRIYVVWKFTAQGEKILVFLESNSISDSKPTLSGAD